MTADPQRKALTATQQEKDMNEQNQSPEPRQDWAGMDGATAFLRIDRHADGCGDIRKMMGEWLAANSAPQPHQAAPVAVPMCSEQAVLHALTMARSETHKQGDAALWQAFGRAMWRQFNAMLAATPPQQAPAPQRKALTDEQLRAALTGRSSGWITDTVRQIARDVEAAHGITQPSQQEQAK